MKSDIDPIRNVGIMAHVDAGKTTLTEGMLHCSGELDFIGRVDDGTAVTDWMRQEQERGITITAAAVQLRWQACRINVVDTPGHVDFSLEVERSLRVMDGAIAVLSAVEGVESQSEAVWRQADRHALPRLVFINKLDREGASFEPVVEQLTSVLKAPALPFVLPIGLGDEHLGVVDLLEQRAVYREQEGGRVRFVSRPIPDELLDEAEFAREVLIDALLDSEADINTFLETGVTDAGALRRAASAAVASGRVVPVLCGSALLGTGVPELLNAVCQLLPAPGRLTAVGGVELPLAALVFKVQQLPGVGMLHFLRIFEGALVPGQAVYNTRTRQEHSVTSLFQVFAGETVEVSAAGQGEIVSVSGLVDTRTGDTLANKASPVTLEPIIFPAPVMALALRMSSAEDEPTVDAAVRALLLEDPSLSARRVQETGELLLEGMGELHLETSVRRLRDDFSAPVAAGKPRVAYRLVPTTLSTAGGEQVGRRASGRGYFARLRVTVTPHVGNRPTFCPDPGRGSIPRALADACMEGIRSAVEDGEVWTIPVSSCQVSLAWAEHHELDSDVESFVSAARSATLRALRASELKVQEPMMRVEIVTLSEYLGVVLGDIGARRGQVVRLDARGQRQVVLAEIPLAEMFGYATQLRSLSQGRASYSMKLQRYEWLPDGLGESLIPKAERLLSGQSLKRKDSPLTD